MKRCPKVDGWAVFNDFEICADNGCLGDPQRGFVDDFEALSHIPTCPDCSAKLGRAVAEDMIANNSFGWWTVGTDIHYPGHITRRDLVDGEEDE